MASSQSQQPNKPVSDDAYSEYLDIGYDYRGPLYPYTPREIRAMLLEFYTFLTTLYIDPKDLHPNRAGLISLKISLRTSTHLKSKSICIISYILLVSIKYPP